MLARLLGRRGQRRALPGVFRGWARALSGHLGIQLRLDGLEHIVPNTPYIATPLHEGLADVLALLQLPIDLRFVARDELFEWPFFGRLLHDTEQVKICPERGMLSYLHLRRQAPDVLAAGESLVVFPQGSILGIEVDFKAGPFALALALDRPILPIALAGGNHVWEHPYSPRSRYNQRVSLQVLPPILPASHRHGGASAFRATVQRQLKARALSGDMAAPRRYVKAGYGFWDGFNFTIAPAFPALRDEVERHRLGLAAMSRCSCQLGQIARGNMDR